MQAAVNKAVQDGIDAGLFVILDLHPNSRHKIYGETAFARATSREQREQYAAMVAEAALELSRFHSGKVALELMNEPRFHCTGVEQQQWQVFLDSMVNAASRSAPDLPLIISGGCASSIEGLLALDPSKWKRKHLFFTFHFYEPFPFTHQGAPFIAWPEKHLSGLPWPATRQADKNAILTATAERLKSLQPIERLQAQSKASLVLASYLASSAGPEAIRKRFDLVAEWADRHGLARNAIFIGEFGVYGGDTRTPGAKCDDRARWISDVRKAAEDLGFAWAFFHLDGPFGVLAGPDKQPDKALLAALGLAGDADCQDLVHKGRFN